MITGAVAFVDTETTGLDRSAEIWEFAAIIRRGDGSESTVHIHIEHDIEAAQGLPERFRDDHNRRFGAMGDVLWARDWFDALCAIGGRWVGAQP
ncbi:exonuclease domain-containing protein [Gordonia sp. SCSIO 19800]|uniref:exonuclease domain-containing protein n=1 Tax=Gordonia sp. SCSIO 19800 TaxID=2826926 RepID=UPI001B821A1E|nr:exonuclease domain-containing protein [Gordonia sp. SCSIO 19800]MBR7191692.1 hypothetical protein [Gordonia sp. SCSIO 19800]